MTKNTLIVTVAISAVKQRTSTAFERAIDDDEPEADAPWRLSFDTTDQLAQVLTLRLPRRGAIESGTAPA